MMISNLLKVVMDRDTGLYLKGDEWTPDKDQATRFKDLVVLFHACEQIPESNLDVVVLMEDPNFDIRIPFRNVNAFPPCI